MKKKKRSRRTRARVPRVLEYYQPLFAWLHLALAKNGYRPDHPADVRTTYWGVVPPGEYPPDEAQPLLITYQGVVERRLEQILSGHSIMYWLHAYRRLGPYGIGEDKSPATIFITRGTLEAAVQRYGSSRTCSGIALSSEVAPNQIAEGFFAKYGLSDFLTACMRKPQLVLTKFGPAEFRELYEVEKLAYEIWRSSAALRITGKGASLLVNARGDVFDARTSELDHLVDVYDGRAGRGFQASASGTAFKTGGRDRLLLVPVYNASHLPTTKFRKFFHRLKIKATPDAISNFLWVPFELGAYCDAHAPFGEAFRRTHAVDLQHVFAVVGALLLRVLMVWEQYEISAIQFWQRAYEAPTGRAFMLHQLERIVPAACELFELGSVPNSSEIAQVVTFLSLSDTNRSRISVPLWGPHFPFLPWSETEVCVDYAWIHRLLYNLFFDINPSDQNFKGEALEKVVSGETSVLPRRPLKSHTGEVRQIDAAFGLGSTLVIVECRAFARSFGIEAGDPRSLAYRRARIEGAVREISRKAEWLSRHPQGANYDISAFERIIPLVVTPFVEFIHTTSAEYWVTRDIPRILTPEELSEHLSDGVIAGAAPGCSWAVPIPVLLG